MTGTRRVILDVDTGNDDAVALMIAALHPAIDLVGCTTAAGNLTIDQTTDNTLRVLDHVGCSDVPVYRGLAKPFAPRPFPFTELEPIHEPTLPLAEPRSRARTTPAVEWLIETLRTTTERITLVPVAPLTNIAAALTVAPEIRDAVDEIVIMGGGHAFGNRTVSAEFNIYYDPVAADVVLQAGFERLVLIPLDATLQALVSDEQIRELDALGTPGGTGAAAVLAGYVSGGVAGAPSVRPVHDALCIAYLLDPDVVRLTRYHVAVDTTGYQSFGRTIVDVRSQGGDDPNAWFATSADAARFYDILRSTLRDDHEQ
ncbi:nucleoside hydrolase [Phytoactinopolyspora halotolerans]|uniref:Inosine/uridine-preferring nucleoside hydrolase domain-containing protein n=1 Tax=Phytoactinopolyspora halotolerans TaxID=1981512 RepID=A0A6L9SEX3_9ACTN|nr:nucleoside hydrolase [Phytoactinopolyspora halotolerans]NEE03002.1 hypothetical protein [Phytoactinopolyspora halotolerans]